jgi:hypothetical protein
MDAQKTKVQITWTYVAVVHERFKSGPFAVLGAAGTTVPERSGRENRRWNISSPAFATLL